MQTINTDENSQEKSMLSAEDLKEIAVGPFVYYEGEDADDDDGDK